MTAYDIFACFKTNRSTNILKLHCQHSDVEKKRDKTFHIQGQKFVQVAGNNLTVISE